MTRDSTIVTLPEHAPPSPEQMEELLAMQRSILQAMAAGRPVAEILDELCRLVEAQVPGAVASIMIREPGSGVLRLHAGPSLPESVVEAFDGIEPGEGQGSCGTAVYRGEPVFVRNVLSDERWRNLRAVAEEFGIGHCWSVPVLGEGGVAVGSLALTGFESRDPSGFHMRLLQTASSLAAIALQHERSREALARSERRLEEIADAMPGVLFHMVRDEGGRRFEYLARGAADLFGVDRQTLLRNPDLLWARVDERDPCPFEEEDRIAEPLDTECLFRIRMADGRRRWIQVQARRVGHERGEAWVGIFLDATERLRQEQALRRARLVFDHAHEGIMITNESLEIIEVNDAFCRITGYSREEALGETPRLLSSGRQSRAFYRRMWEQIRDTGHWEGEIWNRRKNGEVYPEWLSITAARDPHSGEVQYIGVFTDISQLKRTEEELTYLAHHDALTGLPNRLKFRIRLEHAMERARRDGHLVGLLFIDLDRFKNLNDSLGHGFGDRLLRQVANRLSRATRREDLVARLGGDEFVVLLEDLRDVRASGRVAEALIEILGRPYSFEDREFFIGASVGISHFPLDGETIDDLLRAADAALYRAKEEGRGTWRQFTPELTRRLEDWVDLEHGLRRALERGELHLHFQPRVDARSGKVIGAEALLRWAHPEQGMVPPNRFIPLAEEIGLIVDIGDWVLDEVCRTMAGWRHLMNGPLTFSVNLSGQQIMDARLPEKVYRALDRYGCDPSMLELEILESFVMRNAEQSVRTLEQVRDLGVRLAIDDFGSGYSSLAYLKRLPIDKLKIDQSLVFDIPDDPDDVAIAQAVIALGHSLGLEVCAEGVETEEQLDFLVGEGVDEIQGYHFSPPLPADEFLAYLEAHRED